MSSAVEAVQSALVTVLRGDPAITAAVTGVYDGAPPRAAFPYIVINDSSSTDWSTKTARGREVRIAVTVWDDGEEAATLQHIMALIEDAVAGLARDLPGWRVASNIFMRSLVTRSAAGPWAGLVEHRVRVIAA
jgi:Protein of unknown function (DUF3168)